MSDAFSFPVMAASALTQAFGFLYGRAAVILDRRAGHRGDEDAREPDMVPLIVEGDPGPPDVEDAALTPERIERIESLLELLGVYDEHRELIRGDDLRLSRNLGKLRAVLEEVSGRRISFEGEDRPASGVRIEQDLHDVHGTAHALKARRVGHGAGVGVRQNVKTVHPGAEITAAEIDEIG